MKSIQRMKGVMPNENKIEPEGDDLAKALQEAIDKSIVDGLSGRNRKIKGFHASETNECPRYWVYLFRGMWLPPHGNARLQRIFDNGHSFHARIGKTFEDMGIVTGLEIPVNTTLFWTDKDGKKWPVPVESTCDGEIEWNGKAIVEFKSIGDAGFVHRRLARKPKPEHFRQVQIYMAARDLQKAYVIYENKNTQVILVFAVDRDQEFIDKLLKKYAKIFKAFKDGKLPSRYSSPTSTHCQYCSLRDECWSDSDAGVKI